MLLAMGVEGIAVGLSTKILKRMIAYFEQKYKVIIDDFSPFIGGEEINFLYRQKFLINVQIVIKKKFLKGLLNLRNIAKSAILS